LTPNEPQKYCPLDGPAEAPPNARLRSELTKGCTPKDTPGLIRQNLHATKLSSKTAPMKKMPQNQREALMSQQPFFSPGSRLCALRAAAPTWAIRYGGRAARRVRHLVAEGGPNPRLSRDYSDVRSPARYAKDCRWMGNCPSRPPSLLSESKGPNWRKRRAPFPLRHA
jgi:hypothetical protein